MHWLLDVEFKDDLSRYRQGYGAKNMAVVRRFALDLVRAHRKVKASVKRRRKRGLDRRRAVSGEPTNRETRMPI